MTNKTKDIDFFAKKISDRIDKSVHSPRSGGLFVIFHGEHGSGKDTYAKQLKEILKTKYSKESKIYRFADPLREWICRSCRIEESELDEYKRDPSILIPRETNCQDFNIGGLTYREALIKVGEGMKKRRCNPHLFAMQLSDKVVDDILEKRHKIFIITDKRFPAEDELIHHTSFLWHMGTQHILIPEDLPSMIKETK